MQLPHRLPPSERRHPRRARLQRAVHVPAGPLSHAVQQARHRREVHHQAPAQRSARRGLASLLDPARRAEKLKGNVMAPGSLNVT